MPPFPCDNSGDLFKEGALELVFEAIEEKEKELGRKLTQEEIDACYREEDVDPPTEVYRTPIEEYDDELEDDINPNVKMEQINVSTSEHKNPEDIEQLSPQMEEYWRLLQEIAQESGVTATLIPQNKAPTNTVKTRFIFLNKGEK